MIRFLPNRKNDQFRNGQTVYSAKSNKRTCSVVELPLQKLGDKPYALVRRIQLTKAGKRFHPTLGVSYSRIRDVIKSKFGRFVDDPRNWAHTACVPEVFQILVAKAYLGKCYNVMVDGKLSHLRTSTFSLAMPLYLKSVRV